MSEHKTKIILVIRWIGVLPVAIGAFFLANLVTTLLLYIGCLFEDSVWQAIFSNDKVYQFINSITGAIAFIWAGTKIAPKYRQVVAISLTGFFCGFVIVCLFFEGFLHLTTHSLKWFIICGFISIVAAILTCIEICREILNEIRNKFFSASEGIS